MAEWFEKVKNAGISLDRINIFGLIVLLVGAVLCFCGKKLAARFFPERGSASALIKLIALAICIAGFIIAIYF